MTTPENCPEPDWVVVKVLGYREFQDTYHLRQRRNIGAWDTEPRRPTPGRLSIIRLAQENIASAKIALAKELAAAWETGTPVEEPQP